MRRPGRTITILLVEDDAEDRLLADAAFAQAGLPIALAYAGNGEEMLDYLAACGETAAHPLPDLILLDLNMPRMDGREGLRRLKGDPRLCRIPVVVLTTSAAEDDILQAYHLGVSSYIRKPPTFEELVTIAATLGRYWLETVMLPPHG